VVREHLDRWLCGACPDRVAQSLSRCRPAKDSILTRATLRSCFAGHRQADAQRHADDPAESHRPLRNEVRIRACSARAAESLLASSVAARCSSSRSIEFRTVPLKPSGRPGPDAELVPAAEAGDGFGLDAGAFPQPAPRTKKRVPSDLNTLIAPPRKERIPTLPPATRTAQADSRRRCRNTTFRNRLLRRSCVLSRGSRPQGREPDARPRPREEDPGRPSAARSRRPRRTTTARSSRSVWPSSSAASRSSASARRPRSR